MKLVFSGGDSDTYFLFRQDSQFTLVPRSEMLSHQILFTLEYVNKDDGIHRHKLTLKEGL